MTPGVDGIPPSNPHRLAVPRGGRAGAAPAACPRRAIRGAFHPGLMFDRSDPARAVHGDRRRPSITVYMPTEDPQPRPAPGIDPCPSWLGHRTTGPTNPVDIDQNSDLRDIATWMGAIGAAPSTNSTITPSWVRSSSVEVRRWGDTRPGATGHPGLHGRDPCVFRRSRPGIPISSRPPIRREAGHRSDLKPATAAAFPQVREEGRVGGVSGQAG